MHFNFKYFLRKFHAASGGKALVFLCRDFKAVSGGILYFNTPFPYVAAEYTIGEPLAAWAA
jgi:hypothetical protein